MDETDLCDVFERFHVAKNRWVPLGRRLHPGTGWHFRDPTQDDPWMEAPSSVPGTWLLQARVRAGPEIGLSDVQCMCVWEEVPVPLVWTAQTPVVLDSSCLVVCDGHAFRKDATVPPPHPHQYRGFTYEKKGDAWMMDGLEQLDRAPRSGTFPLPFVHREHGWWFHTEPIVLWWDAAHHHDRVCGLRWSFPLEGAASWDP